MKNLRNSLMTGGTVQGVFWAVLGLIFILFPHGSASLLCRIAGLALLLPGIHQIYLFVREKEARSGTLYVFLILGIAAAVVGLWLLLWPRRAQALVITVLAIVILIHGCQDISVAVTLFRQGSSQRWVVALLSVATLAAGLFVLLRPGALVSAVMTVCGICLLIDGLSDIWIWSRLPRDGRGR